MNALPSQIGFTPSGSIYGSQVWIGGNTTGAWDAIGIGANGRPDALSGLHINLGSFKSPFTIPVRINIEAADVMRLIAMNTTSGHVPTQLNLKLTEVSVCEEENGDTVEKRMVILASQTYQKPNGA